MIYDEVVASGSANDGTPTPLILSNNSARKMVAAQDPATAPIAHSDYDYFRGRYAAVGDGEERSLRSSREHDKPQRSVESPNLIVFGPKPAHEEWIQ